MKNCHMDAIYVLLFNWVFNLFFQFSILAIQLQIGKLITIILRLFKDLIAKWGVNEGAVVWNCCPPFLDSYVHYYSNWPPKCRTPCSGLDFESPVILLCERNLFSSHTKWTWSLSSELFSSLFSSLLHCSVCGLLSLQRVQKMPWLESRFCMHTMWSTTALELYTLHDISNIHQQMFSWALLFQSDRNLLAINPFYSKLHQKCFNFVFFQKFTKFNSKKTKSVLH